MKTAWKLLLPVPFLLALVAMVPQGPGSSGASDAAKDEITAQIRFAELQYVDRAGQTHAVPSRNILLLRLMEDVPEGLRLEIYYENGDYSLIDVQGFHLLRQGRDVQEVKLARTRRDRMLFPRIP